jgi:phosphoglycolate phosphatase/putative hydrolase of the HAD superfamily
MKNIYEYKCGTFDMDGTLYYQSPLRILMIINMILYCILHPFRIKEIFIVRYFRKIRENENLLKNKNFKTVQYELVAGKFKISQEETKNIINFWLIKKPIKVFKFIQRQKISKNNRHTA